MMARIRKSMEEKDQGFTLIELLVVMIIIGILAAIAVPVFLSQRTKARETSAKADASAISKDIASYYVDGSGALAVAGPVASTTFNGATTVNGYTLSTTGSGAAVQAVGKLSNGNKVLPASSITSATAYCVAIQSGYDWSNSSSTSTDGIWKVTQDGLLKGTC